MPPRGRPRTGITPLRNVRVPDDLWNPAMAAAHDRGETLTDVITDALRRYVTAHRRETAKRAAADEVEAARKQARRTAPED